MKLCPKSFFNFINSLIELDEDQTADIGRQFKGTFVQDRHALAPKSHQKHAQFQNYILSGAYLFFFWFSGSVTFVIGRQ